MWSVAQPTPDPPEVTPLLVPEPAPAPLKFEEPVFGVAGKEFVQPCYVCGYGCVEYAQYPKYQIFMHYGCWAQHRYRPPNTFCLSPL